VVLGVEKSRRLLYLLGGIAVAVLLGLGGFYSGFFLYFTRTGHLDLTFTGRTVTWAQGWDLLWKSPLIGMGFQADRVYLQGMHMHNAFLHALVQSGLVGGLAIIIALVIVSYYSVKYFFITKPSDESLIPAEIPAILLFTIVSSVTESTFAYYSAAWLLAAPIFGYVVALHMHMRRNALKAAKERQRGLRMTGRNARPSRSRREEPPPPPAEGVPG